MKKIFNNINNTFKNCGVLKSTSAMAILSGVCVILQAIAQNGLNALGALSIIVFPYLLLLNALPLFLIMCAAYFITNRVWTGFLAAALPLNILLAVNYFKVYFRSETLTVHDFSLFSEASNIMTGYNFPVPIPIIILLILSIAVFIYAFYNITHKPTRLYQRAVPLAITAIVSICAYFTFYNGTEMYSKLPSLANKFNDISIASNKGFVYTFLTHISSYEYTAPEGYSDEKITALLGNDPDAVNSADEKINVIAVMSEAFFDMESCENVEFYKGLNPTPNLTRLRKSSRWGHIFVPGFAGSTASTEFEFLTGINISNIDSAMPVVYKTHVAQDCYSLVQMFKDMGYTTTALHPGKEWFYNRKAVYPRLGFDKTYFEDDFEYTSKDLVNYYVSDKVTSDRIISEYRDYLNSGADNGYMSFTVTIQNHGPYKNTRPETVRIKNTGGIDEEGYNTLLNYANGLYDADELLGRICDFTDKCNKPTIVVFFGDHLPYFDAEGKYLTWLGMDVSATTPESLENRYSTPYIIHGNEAFAEMMNKKGNTVLNGNKEQISSSFLGAELIKYMGITPPPYFTAIEKIENRISEISDYFYIVDGEHKTELTDTDSKLLNDYKYLSYWALREYRR